MRQYYIGTGGSQRALDYSSHQSPWLPGHRPCSQQKLVEWHIPPATHVPTVPNDQVQRFKGYLKASFCCYKV